MGRTQFWILGSQCHCTLCIAHCALFIVQATTGQFRPKLDQTREYGEYDEIKEEPPKGEPPKDTLTQWHWTWTCTGLWVLDSISFSLVLFPASSCLLKATWHASNCNKRLPLHILLQTVCGCLSTESGLPTGITYPVWALMKFLNRFVYDPAE